MPTLRQLIHALVALLAWVAFVGLWVLLYEQGKLSSDAVTTSGASVGAIAVGVAIVTLAWVNHNIRIHRRKGPRMGRPLNPPVTDVDRLDRPVTWDLPGGPKEARRAGIVVVELDGETKRYRSGVEG